MFPFRKKQSFYLRKKLKQFQKLRKNKVYLKFKNPACKGSFRQLHYLKGD